MGVPARRTDNSGNGNTVTNNRVILNDDHISFIRRVKRAEMPGLAEGTDRIRGRKRRLGIHENTKIGIIY